MKAVASAPGKVILTGEHFVVYGEPALVVAINRYVQVTVELRPDQIIHVSSSLGASGFFENDVFKPERGEMEAQKILTPIKIAAETTLTSLGEKRGLDIEITSTIPVAVGLGSSGSTAVATVAAVGKLLGGELTREAIVKISTQAEQYVHLHPSGIDQSISTYGGILCFTTGETIMPLQVQGPLPLIIGNTKMSRNTGKQVDNVRMQMERYADVLEPLTQAAGRLTRHAVDALQRGNLIELGLLMDINHGFLTAIGVSNNALDNLVYAARKGGALGAKMTGAGGGGCIVASSFFDQREAVARAILEAGGTPMLSDHAGQGVHSWIVGSS